MSNPSEDDWKKMIKLVEAIHNRADAEPFRIPVDWKAYVRVCCAFVWCCRAVLCFCLIRVGLHVRGCRGYSWCLEPCLSLSNTHTIHSHDTTTHTHTGPDGLSPNHQTPHGFGYDSDPIALGQTTTTVL
jgi:hypothetical protein